MTEQEAKTKWCPKYKAAMLSSHSCDGSRCMMWRWYSHKPEVHEGKTIYVPVTEGGGFCGLGGMFI